MIRRKHAAMVKTILARLLVMVMILSSVITVAPKTSALAATKKQPAISKKVSSILVGKTYDLNIKNKVAGSTYKWTSSNKKVATVDKNGVVTGVKQGTVTISCKVTTPKATYVLSNKVTIRQPAKSIKINNKITTVNVGQTYDLNRTITPKTSLDTTTWTSSSNSIVKMGKWGEFTALKEGKVTITAKTLSGKTDKVTIQVIDKKGLVSNQKELDALLGSGAELITLKTDEETVFTIPEGNYSKQTLVVDAPKADIVNKGVFKAVEIKNIKSETWTEQAVGNVLVVSAAKVRIIINKEASSSVKVKSDSSKLTLVNNGTVKELTVDAKAEVTISGTSKDAIPVNANAADAVITTSIPLTVKSNEKVKLVILPGAEKTTVTVEDEKFIPTIIGNVTIVITIEKGDNIETKQVVGTPDTTQPSTGGGGGGGGSTPTPTPTSKTVTVKHENGKFTLPVKYTELTKVVVNYNGEKYTIGADILTMLKGFLSNSRTTIDLWNSVQSYSKTYEGKQVTINGPVGLTKDVTFGDKTYNVEVKDAGDNTTIVVTTQSGTVYSLNKSADNKSLIISNAPDSLTFDVTYLQ
ncbi:Ig-like domain-containing protein [Anaerocolumna aminovalerica]|uniref:Ig-like domain-containing protein n=1 Tax=Anaerocolumna aminovalerica TaxID=1527 RepID=UPI00248C025A|nr:Ig-like domain-containing protein [Anaerocolumna aminovalerica]